MRPVIAIACSLMALTVQAQTVRKSVKAETTTTVTVTQEVTQNTANDRARRTSAFSHFDGTVSLGTTGIGFEVSTPLGRSWNLRGGRFLGYSGESAKGSQTFLPTLYVILPPMSRREFFVATSKAGGSPARFVFLYLPSDQCARRNTGASCSATPPAKY